MKITDEKGNASTSLSMTKMGKGKFKIADRETFEFVIFLHFPFHILHNFCYPLRKVTFGVGSGISRFNFVLNGKYFNASAESRVH